MTNTLHRFQKPDDVKDDYLIFTIACKGANEIGAAQKQREFLRAAIKYNPVNICGGYESGGSLFRPEKNLNLLKLYVRGRRETASPEEAIEGIENAGVALVVFDNKDALENFLKEVKQMDLGLSVNISALVDDVKEMAPRTGVHPHSINYAMGFRGDLYRLPERKVLALTTLCGHGMISSNFARKMLQLVREKRLTPEKAAKYMAKFCVCGAFNTSRAVRILTEDFPQKVEGAK